MSKYREELENYLKKVEVNEKNVADIGGGANPVHKRVKAWNVSNYIVFDNEAEELKTTDEKVYDLDLNEELDQYTKAFFWEQFDHIFCLEVFEYIYNPVQAMRNINNLLKEGGFATITFPTLYPLHNPKDIDYLRYTFEGIQKLCEVSRFEIVDLISRNTTDDAREGLRKFWSSDGMKVRKSEPRVYDTGYILEVMKSAN